MKTHDDFIGAGWAFRRDSGIGIDSQGNIALVSGDADMSHPR